MDLEENVVPFVPVIGDNFIPMHDNARLYVARLTIKYLQEIGIQVLDWPVVSPD